MTVSTKLRLSMILLASAILALAGVLAYTVTSVHDRIVEKLGCDLAVRQVYQLSVFGLEFQTDRDDRPALQWRETHRDLRRTLDDIALGVDTLEEKRILAQLVDNHQVLGSLFEKLVSGQASSPEADRLIAQSLQLRQNVMIDLVSHLSAIGSEAILAGGRSAVAALAAAIVGVVLVGGIILLASRRIITALSALRRGTDAVGARDFHYRVQVGGGDEFSALAASMNCSAGELEKSYADLARSNAELQRFAEISAHHLQEPAARIARYSDRLKAQLAGRLDDAEARLSLDFIGEQARHQQRLLRDVQRYLVADQPRGPVGTADARAVAERVLGKLAGPIAGAGASVTLGDLPAAEIDLPRLADLFEIAVENALTHGHGSHPPHIVLAGERIGDRARYSVSDNGPGIDKIYRDQVFRVFERLTSDGLGTGIGLAILRRTTESIGGHAWIEDAPGGGCRLLFDLPGGASP